jgi:uncharacterized protein (DUF736 family)
LPTPRIANATIDPEDHDGFEITPEMGDLLFADAQFLGDAQADRLHRYAGQRYEIGAGWSQVAKSSGETYLNLKIGAPEFGPSWLGCRLVKFDHPAEDGATHIALWEPPRPLTADAPPRRVRGGAFPGVSGSINPPAWRGRAIRCGVGTRRCFHDAFQHMGDVFRPHPRRASADIHVERGRRDRDGHLERFLRFLDATELAERGGEPTVVVRVIGVCPDRPFRRLDRSRVFPAEIKSER